MRERGFSLIELMVAITLVAAISVGMLMTMRTSLTTLDRVDSRLQSNRRVMSVEQILSRELSGVMPVVGDCRTSDGGIRPRTPIFSGTDQTLVLVSSYSLAEGARGYPRLLALQVVPADRGGVRLIVNESLYTGPSSTAPFCLDGAAVASPPMPSSFVVADRLAFCRLSYQDFIPAAPQLQKWQAFWNKPDLPSAVHVEMTPQGADPASLPLLSVTVPIHVTREVINPYADMP